MNVLTYFSGMEQSDSTLFGEIHQRILNIGGESYYFLYKMLILSVVLIFSIVVLWLMIGGKKKLIQHSNYIVLIIFVTVLGCSLIGWLGEIEKAGKNIIPTTITQQTK